MKIKQIKKTAKQQKYFRIGIPTLILGQTHQDFLILEINDLHFVNFEFIVIVTS